MAQFTQRKKTENDITEAGGQSSPEIAPQGILKAFEKLAEAVEKQESRKSKVVAQEAKAEILEEAIVEDQVEIEEEELEDAEVDSNEDSEEVDEIEGEEVADEEEQEDEELPSDKKRESLPPKVQASIDKRIAKEVAKRKAVEDEVKHIRAQLELVQAAPPPELNLMVGDDWLVRPDTKERVEMPRAAAYGGDVAQYMEDMAKFNNLRQRVVTAVTSYHRKQTAEQVQMQVIEAEYKPRLNAATEKYKDFVQVVDSPEQRALEAAHKWVVPTLKESEYGPDIVYLLGKDKALLKEMINMSPSQVAKQIGKLEAQLEMSVKPRTTSAAPKPIRSAAQTGSKVAASIKPAKKVTEMSYKELKEQDKSQRYRR